MEPLITLIEIALFTVAICLAHRLKEWLGLAPLYLLVGFAETFMWVHSNPQARVVVELFEVQPPGIFLLFLTPMLVSVILVYVLEGTREARRLIMALALLYVVHGVVDAIVHYHAVNPPEGKPYLGDARIVWFNTKARVASLFSVIVDFLVMIIAYQFLHNRFPRVPLAVPLFVALCAGMFCDAVVFELVYFGKITTRVFYIGAKAQAGVAAALVAASYFWLELRRHPGEVRRGILVRGALEIVAADRRVREMEQRLEEQKARYQHIKHTFSRYVSPDVVDTILSDPARLELGGQLREVTVLFADIRGYSTLSENLAPTEVIELLNTYFQRVSIEILKHGGMINEFEGDAVLAIFNAPIDLDRHPEMAVRSALGMLAAVEDLNAEWEQDGTLDKWRQAGLDGFKIRIGVHTGEVVAGNVGSEARTKYAVIGDTVNTAARVESLNKDMLTWLLLTESTFEGMGSIPLAELAIEMGLHRVKGRTEPVRVYTLELEEAQRLARREVARVEG